MNKDDKYVVFKREDLVLFEDTMKSPNYPTPVPDAVVIRCQDLLAAPALNSYAFALALAADLIEDHDEYDARLEGLRDAGDYFLQRAEQAAAEGYKLPD